jgi:hypothetical protein
MDDRRQIFNSEGAVKDKGRMQPSKPGIRPCCQGSYSAIVSSFTVSPAYWWHYDNLALMSFLGE